MTMVSFGPYDTFDEIMFSSVQSRCHESLKIWALGWKLLARTLKCSASQNLFTSLVLPGDNISSNPFIAPWCYIHLIWFLYHTNVDPPWTTRPELLLEFRSSIFSQHSLFTTDGIWHLPPPRNNTCCRFSWRLEMMLLTMRMRMITTRGRWSASTLGKLASRWATLPGSSTVLSTVILNFLVMTKKMIVLMGNNTEHGDTDLFGFLWCLRSQIAERQGTAMYKYYGQ